MTKGKRHKLIQTLSSFEPLKQLECTSDELEALPALRGRASHADSKDGVEEIARVKDEVFRKLPRLKCLVERVIVTKKR